MLNKQKKAANILKHPIFSFHDRCVSIKWNISDKSHLFHLKPVCGAEMKSAEI